MKDRVCFLGRLPPCLVHSMCAASVLGKMERKMFAEKIAQKLPKGWEPKPRVLGFIYHEAENSDQQQQSYPCCRHVLKALLKSQDILPVCLLLITSMPNLNNALYKYYLMLKVNSELSRTMFFEGLLFSISLSGFISVL